MGGEPSSAPARLFYDPGCGPCTFFARVSQWASGSRLRSLPFDGNEASRDLGDMDGESRFAYAHLVGQGGRRRSGADTLSPLVGLTFGPTGERIVTQVWPVDRGLRWIYTRFWNYRRTRGCASGSLRLPL